MPKSYMYAYDDERKHRPWHLYDESVGTRSFVFAVCGKIMDVRPKGITIVGSVDDESTVCSLCLIKRDQESAE